MRVVCAYTDWHVLSEQSLDRYAPAHEPVWVGEREDLSYYELLCRLWRDGESFLIVEHDIEIHDRVVPVSAACSEWWCVWPYNGAGRPGTDRMLYRALGCTKFHADLLAAHPRFMDELPVRHWKRLDSEVNPGLTRLGLEPHVHAPPVTHHHVYDGVCACEQDHDAA